MSASESYSQQNFEIREWLISRGGPLRPRKSWGDFPLLSGLKEKLGSLSLFVGFAPKASRFDTITTSDHIVKPPFQLNRATLGFARTALRLTLRRGLEEVTVLEIFTGWVDRIDDARGTAFVTLTDSQGRVTYAEIARKELADAGIEGAQGFECKVLATPRAGAALTLTALPRRELSKADYAEVRESVERTFPQEILDAVVVE